MARPTLFLRTDKLSGVRRKIKRLTYNSANQVSIWGVGFNFHCRDVLPGWGKNCACPCLCHLLRHRPGGNIEKALTFCSLMRKQFLNNWITGVLQLRVGTRHHPLLPGSLSRYGGGGCWPVTEAGRGLHWYEAVAAGTSQTEPYIASLIIFQVYNYCLYGLPAHLRKENTKLSISAVSMEE